MEIKICDEFFYRVKDCSMDIFQEFNTSKDNVLRNNKEIDIYQGEWIKIKKNNFTTHYVKPAENIAMIAETHHVSIEKILKENDLTTDKLFIGQILKIYK